MFAPLPMSVLLDSGFSSSSVWNSMAICDMVIDLGMQVGMSDEEFLAEMQERVERFDLTKNDHVIGCPLCLHAIPVPSPIRAEAQTDGAGGVD